MRILLVSSRFPEPPRRGNQLRTLQWMEALEAEQLSVLCPAPAAVQPESDERLICWPRPGIWARLWGLLRAAASGRPLQEGLYDSAAARRTVARALEAEPWDAVVVQMLRVGWVMELVARQRPELPLLFDLVDSMTYHLRVGRCDFHPLLRPLLGLEARRCRRRERALAHAARLTVAVSARDLCELDLPEGRAEVLAVPGREWSQDIERASQPTVVLTGNLGYRPTVRAVRWFGARIWPELRRRVPRLRWVLAGARPARVVREVAQLPGVELVADPPSLEPVLGQAWVALAPMASGSGIPLKVLEAWAAGVPVVAHPHAVAGLVDGGGDGVVRVETANQWVDAVVRLVNDRNAAEALGRRGREQRARHYDRDTLARGLRELVQRVVA